MVKDKPLRKMVPAQLQWHCNKELMLSFRDISQQRVLLNSCTQLEELESLRKRPCTLLMEQDRILSLQKLEAEPKLHNKLIPISDRS